MIGSITKTFTAEAISLLIKQGKISLTDALKAFVPMLPNASRVHVKNLLVHSSGIKDYYALNEFNKVRNEAISLQDFTRWISQYDPEFKPGTRNSYSNSGYNLLAFLIESVSDLKYSEFLKTYIFSPLEMNSTGSFEKRDKHSKNLVKGFSPGSLPTLLGPPNEIHPSWLTGSGSVFSSAGDLLKWCSVIESRMNADEDWIPYGWGVRSRDSIQYLEQHGRIPGYSSIIQIIPALSLNIIILNRIESDAVNAIAKGINSLLLDEDVEVAALEKLKNYQDLSFLNILEPINSLRISL